MRAWQGRAALATALGAWAGLADTGLVRHRALAGPIATVGALGSGLADGTLVADAAATMARTAAGVALGLAAGLPIGLWLGTSAARRRTLEPGLDFLRAIPPLLVFPLLLLAFGYGERARVGAVAWAAALLVALHVSHVAARARPERARALRAMGFGWWHRLRWLHAYEILPGLLTSLRHALGTGLVVAVVTEMVVGAPHGLGARAVSAQVAYDTPGLYAVIVATGLFGWTLGRALLALERRIVFWTD